MFSAHLTEGKLWKNSKIKKNTFLSRLQVCLLDEMCAGDEVLNVFSCWESTGGVPLPRLQQEGLHHPHQGPDEDPRWEKHPEVIIRESVCLLLHMVILSIDRSAEQKQSFKALKRKTQNIGRHRIYDDDIKTWTNEEIVYKMTLAVQHGRGGEERGEEHDPTNCLPFHLKHQQGEA